MDEKKGRTPAPVKNYCARNATRTLSAPQSGAGRCCQAAPCLWCQAQELADSIPYLHRSRKHSAISEVLAKVLRALKSSASEMRGAR